MSYFNAYRQVIATHESIEMWFIKVIFLGAPRLGKTTVRRRLTGEISDISSSGEAEQPSTGTVESAPSVVIRNLSSTTALVTPTEWTVTKNLTEEIQMFLQFFYSHTQGTIARQSISNKVKKLALKEESVEVNSSLLDVQKNFSEFVATLKSTPLQEQSRHLPVQALAEVVDLFHKVAGPKYWKDIKHLFKDTAFLKMEDTGGQPEFMDMLPALTIGPALYLLFCKLIDNLKSRYTVSYLSPSGESTTPVESTYTVEEVIFTALASISCFKSYSSFPEVSDEETTTDSEELLTSYKKSIAYIVGTHKDKVSEQQIDEFDKKLQHAIRATDFFREGLVKVSSEHRMVLPIDNMNGGDEEIQDVRKFLEEGMKQLRWAKIL